MNSKSIIVSILAISLFFNCKDQKSNEEFTTSEMQATGDTSMTSLDWEGTYEGFLPCADCEGIKTAITLNKDNTYLIRASYQGKSDSVFDSKGTFKWDDKGRMITFSDQNRHNYLVGENTLTHLDNDGNKISGVLANNYILIKSEEKLVGKKWHLVSFKGEEIQLQEAKAEHAHVEFLADETMVGYTGCNNFQGGYFLKEGHEIKFSNIISTKKSCPEMETEHEFLSTMTKATFYKFQDHALIIHDENHNPLATFKAAN